MSAARDDERSAGFLPIAAATIHTLILGSLPSRASLAEQQYYAHPRNAFWPLMGRLLNAGPELAYDQRVATLLASGIGVWDVLESSVRPGSLDADIDMTTARVNDFERFLQDHGQITRVLFNGKKAAQVFDKRVMLTDERRDSIEFFDMPSTSPAHAAMSFEQKLAAWSIVLDTPS